MHGARSPTTGTYANDWDLQQQYVCFFRSKDNNQLPGHPVGSFRDGFEASQITRDGQGCMRNEVDAHAGSAANLLLSTNWHSLNQTSHGHHSFIQSVGHAVSHSVGSRSLQLVRFGRRLERGRALIRRGIYGCLFSALPCVRGPKEVSRFLPVEPAAAEAAQDPSAVGSTTDRAIRRATIDRR